MENGNETEKEIKKTFAADLILSYEGMRCWSAADLIIECLTQDLYVSAG